MNQRRYFLNIASGRPRGRRGMERERRGKNRKRRTPRWVSASLSTGFCGLYRILHRDRCGGGRFLPFALRNAPQIIFVGGLQVRPERRIDMQRLLQPLSKPSGDLCNRSSLLKVTKKILPEGGDARFFASRPLRQDHGSGSGTLEESVSRSFLSVLTSSATVREPPHRPFPSPSDSPPRPRRKHRPCPARVR